MFPVGFRFPSKEGEASSEAERSPFLRLRDGLVPLPEGGRSFPPFLQKGTPMLFFIVHDVPGRVRLRARYGFSLRKAQVLADRLDAVGGIEGVRVNPRTGSVLLLYANDRSPSRAAFLLLAVAASEQPSGDVAVCGENLPEPSRKAELGAFSPLYLCPAVHAGSRQGGHGGGGLRSLYPQRGCGVVPWAPQCGCP